jgi:hypothetical protein
MDRLNLDIIHELTIYNINFSNKLINKIANLKTNKIAIINKKFNTPIFEIIKKIQDINPNLEIIPYYSLKYHQKDSLKNSAQEFRNNLEILNTIGIKNTLLISGSPKPKYDSIQVLEYLKDTYSKNKLPQIAVAYNPFLRGNDLDIENKRVQKKLETNLISAVCLQIGIETESIQNAVDYLRTIQPGVKIYLSLMNPSPSRLAQFRYRPWKGVYLPQEYINSAEQANQINQSIYKLAQDMDLGIIQGE